jgi:hypothetical protein
VATISAAHFQDIAKTGRGDHAKLATLSLKQRIGANRRAMHHRRHARRAPKRAKAREKTRSLITALAWHFRGLKTPCRGIKQKQIGEGATDINADNCAAHDARFP